MRQQVTIIATLHARPGMEEALEARMRTMIAATRQEPGCIRYDLQRSELDSASYVMIEYWADAQALQLHFDSPHMAALSQDLPELLDRPVHIERLTLVA